MESTEQKVKVNALMGKNNGLRLVMDANSSFTSFGTIEEDFNAFSLYIGTPEELPVMKQRSIPIQPGFEHFIELKGDVLTSNNIRGLNTDERDCLFTDEGNIKHRNVSLQQNRNKSNKLQSH